MAGESQAETPVLQEGHPTITVSTCTKVNTRQGLFQAASLWGAEDQPAVGGVGVGGPGISILTLVPLEVLFHKI